MQNLTINYAKFKFYDNNSPITIGQYRLQDANYTLQNNNQNCTVHIPLCKLHHANYIAQCDQNAQFAFEKYRHRFLREGVINTQWGGVQNRLPSGATC